jgi:hypothetical protein
MATMWIVARREVDATEFEALAIYHSAPEAHERAMEMKELGKGRAVWLVISSDSEPLRNCWRLQSLRDWSHEQIKIGFPRGEGAAVRLVFEHEHEHTSR